MQPTDDSVLLRQYAASHSDEAFAALARRHIDLVYSVALRCVGDPHQAKEVAQAVFILLAKKAAQLRHDRALSSGLFQTTRLTASNFARGFDRPALVCPGLTVSAAPIVSSHHENQSQDHRRVSRTFER